MEWVIEIPSSSFDEEIKETEKPVVVEFWRRSCNWCKRFKPVYEQLPEVFGGKVKFLKINMLKSIGNLRLAEGLGVDQTPTLKLFCGGRSIGEIVGYRSLERVVEEIEEILNNQEQCLGWKKLREM